MRSLCWLDVPQEEVSPTPTLGHWKVDGEPFLSLCAQMCLPTHTNLGAADSSAGSSSHEQTRIASVHSEQIKTETQDRHGGAASVRSLRLTPDLQAAVLTV